MRRRAVAGLLAPLALALPGCDRDIADGDLAIDNRTGVGLTIVRLHESGSPGSGTTVGVVSPQRIMGIAGVDGCSSRGFEARTPDGEVVATLPPREFGSADCKFAWMIEEHGSHLER